MSKVTESKITKGTTITHNDDGTITVLMLFDEQAEGVDITRMLSMSAPPDCEAAGWPHRRNYNLAAMKYEWTQTFKLPAEPPADAPVDHVAETKQFRKDLDAILQRIKESPRTSGERSVSIERLQESIMWLGMDLKDQNTPDPYPESRNPESPVIEPTADGLKL
jgi:hypothetical protein